MIHRHLKNMFAVTKLKKSLKTFHFANIHAHIFHSEHTHLEDRHLRKFHYPPCPSPSSQQRVNALPPGCQSWEEWVLCDKCWVVQISEEEEVKTSHPHRLCVIKVYHWASPAGTPPRLYSQRFDLLLVCWIHSFPPVDQRVDLKFML